MTPISIHKATKAKTKMRLSLAGPSGSGKTYSALLMASGMTSWDKICVIDTENGSADLYSSLGAYSVITLSAPYSPERYIEAIEAAEAAGMEVVVIDSATHEWDGSGGLLEANELLAHSKYRGNTWAAWSQTTPRHQKFLHKLLNSSCHIIATTRSKTETVQTDDKKVKKLGMKEIQREGFEYEFTLTLSIDRETHAATTMKDRTGLFITRDPFVITAKTGAEIKAWCDDGVEKPPELKATFATNAQLEELVKLLKKKGFTEADLCMKYSVMVKEDLTETQALKAINGLAALKDAVVSSPVQP